MAKQGENPCQRDPCPPNNNNQEIDIHQMSIELYYVSPSVDLPVCAYFVRLDALEELSCPFPPGPIVMFLANCKQARPSNASCRFYLVLPKNTPLHLS